MIARHILRAIHRMELMATISIIWTANVDCQSIHPPIGTPLPDPQQVVTSIELKAINDPATGKGAFVFEGREVPPVVRAAPGGAIRLEYINQMVTGPKMDRPEAALGCTRCDGTSVAIGSEETIQHEGHRLEPESDIKPHSRGPRLVSEEDQRKHRTVSRLPHGSRGFVGARDPKFPHAGI
jgi:hypothetical protein